MKKLKQIEWMQTLDYVIFKTMFSFLNRCAQYLTIIMTNWQPMSPIFDWNGHRHGTGETFKNIMIVIQTDYN